MWDYHGFVPYIGGGIAYEKIRLMETENEDELTDLTYQKISPNIVFGWDIRPSMKGDWWILRTNLRYFPFLTIGHQNHSLSLQHLEFNFIQFVLYPQKLKRLKHYQNTVFNNCKYFRTSKMLDFYLKDTAHILMNNRNYNQVTFMQVNCIFYRIIEFIPPLKWPFIVYKNKRSNMKTTIALILFF